MELFDLYPRQPGHRNTDTSIAAARDIAPVAPTIREKIFSVFAACASTGLTADQACHRAHVSLLSGRPRVTELQREGRLVDSNLRRPLDSGKQGIVWKVSDNCHC